MYTYSHFKGSKIIDPDYESILIVNQNSENRNQSKSDNPRTYAQAIIGQNMKSLADLIKK